MQNLRRISFFNRSEIKPAGIESRSRLTRGLNSKIIASCVGPSSSGNGGLWLAERGGKLHYFSAEELSSNSETQKTVSENFSEETPEVLPLPCSTSSSWNVINDLDVEIIGLESVPDRQVVVVLFRELSLGTKYIAYSCVKKSEDNLTPLKLREATVFLTNDVKKKTTNVSETPRTAACFAVGPRFRCLAVGTREGEVFLFHGADLLADRNCQFTKIVDLEINQEKLPITGLYFSKIHETRKRLVLFVSTTQEVLSFDVLFNYSEHSGPVQLLNVDKSYGVPAFNLAHFSVSLNGLVVAQDRSIVVFDPEYGNVSAMSADTAVGESKIELGCWKNYMWLVTQTEEKCHLTVVLMYPNVHVRFITFRDSFPLTIVNVLPGPNGRSLLVLCQNPENFSVSIFELGELSFQERLNLLQRKSWFDWAIELAVREGQSSETVAELYLNHAESFFKKIDFLKAMDVHCRALELRLPIDTSAVITR
jgi:hypothetical protein